MSITRLNQLLAFHEANPKDSFILFALAKEHEKLGDDEKALHYYEQLVRQEPGYVGVYYHLGKLHEKLSDPATAFAIYKTRSCRIELAAIFTTYWYNFLFSNNDQRC